ncbi:MAG: hypothetical protein H7A03_03020 [Pseudomonadales bacterium]|nr:hypothetical protein [Pseudomonadales bacterium]
MNIIQQLITAAHSAPSADNSQPWHFDWDGTRLTVKYDSERVAGKTFPPESQATLLSIGGSIENICTLLNSYGLEPSVHWPPASGDTCPYYAQISFTQTSAKASALDSDTLKTILNRHTNRFPYQKEPLKHSAQQSIETLSCGNARLLFIEERDQRNGLWELVKSATEIRFQTKEVHEWLGASLRFKKDSVKNSDGLDIDTLGLPPGGSLMLRGISNWNRMKWLNKLGIYKLLAKIDSAPVRQAPAIIAIVGQNNRQGAIEAGRLLVRCWNALNAQGLAVHPYYVVSDQINRLQEGTVPKELTDQAQQIQQKCNGIFQLADSETLYMLLRTGYPKKEKPPRSARLPLEQVFSDHSKA